MRKLANQHHGEIIEIQVRKNAISIMELSRRLGVSRRSIYNWFSQNHLKEEVIQNVGLAIGHDFSSELPQLSKKTSSFDNRMNIVSFEKKSSLSLDSVSYWQEKYLDLLEEHCRVLTKSFTQHSTMLKK